MVTGKLRRLFPVLLCTAVLLGGCGQETPEPAMAQIELLEPVGVGMSYVEAERRNLYEAEVYSGIVCPFVEEYEMEKSFSFGGFDAWPGEAVRKGSALLHADTEQIDDKIREMEKSIAAMEEEYLEYAADTREAMIEPMGERDRCKSILDNLERDKPEQYLPAGEPGAGQEDGTPGEGQEDGAPGDGESSEPRENPAYTAWAQDYKRFDGQYRNLALSVDILEEKLKQRTELYELDHAWMLTQLEQLEKERSRSVLTAGMNGYVASLGENVYGQANGKKPLVAVADTDRLELRCDYINKAAVSKAEEVYAVVNGKRYEVEYHALESDEYNRLKEQNDKVYSTFTFLGDTESVSMGSYAAIIVVKQSARDVVAVPRDAVRKDDSGSYVYVVKDGESVYTPVRTGMRDGLYTEILSGVEAGDKMLSEQSLTAGESRVKLETGKTGSQFNGEGLCVYPDREAVVNPVKYGTCYYVERQVSLYQQVKKGDVLATIRVVADQTELERNERKLTREQERLADLKKLGEEENKKAIAAKEEVIRELEELIAEMKADFATSQIRSPMDGVITYVNEFEKEQLLPGESVLFYVANDELNYIVVEDKNGQLTYGNRVSVFYTGANNEKQEAFGTVVTLNHMALSKALLTDPQEALILVDPEYVGDIAGTTVDEDGWWHNYWYKVSVPIRTMENVLLVPRKAVTEVSGSTYVKVWTQDGGVDYVSFIAGGSDGANYWVAEGLTEGMEICLE